MTQARSETHGGNRFACNLHWLCRVRAGLVTRRDVGLVVGSCGTYWSGYTGLGGGVWYVLLSCSISSQPGATRRSYLRLVFLPLSRPVLSPILSYPVSNPIPPSFLSRFPCCPTSLLVPSPVLFSWPVSCPVLSPILSRPPSRPVPVLSPFLSFLPSRPVSHPLVSYPVLFSFMSRLPSCPASCPDFFPALSRPLSCSVSFSPA